MEVSTHFDKASIFQITRRNDQAQKPQERQKTATITTEALMRASSGTRTASLTSRTKIFLSSQARIAAVNRVLMTSLRDRMRTPPPYHSTHHEREHGARLWR
jgi:hypothetical protein